MLLHEVAVPLSLDCVLSRTVRTQSLGWVARHSDSTQEAILAESCEDYYDRLDPVGVAERHQENKMIENQLCEVEVNYLGHLLVGNAPAFCDHVMANGPPEVTAQLVAVANSLSPSVCSNSNYEEVYFQHAESAFSWQEDLDDACLLNVLKLLREYVKIVEYLLYIDD